MAQSPIKSDVGLPITKRSPGDPQYKVLVRQVNVPGAQSRLIKALDLVLEDNPTLDEIVHDEPTPAKESLMSRTVRKADESLS